MKKQPTLRDTFLVGKSPIYIALEHTRDDQIAWYVNIDITEVPDWVDPESLDELLAKMSSADGVCASLAEARTASLAVAYKMFKRYRQFLRRQATKLAKQVAKNLAAVEHFPLPGHTR